MRSKPSVSFSDLSESEEFSEFFSLMWNLTGLVIGLVDPAGRFGKAHFTPEMMCPVCHVIRSTPEGAEACRLNAEFYCDLAAQRKQSIHYCCHAGMIDFVVPVFVEGYHVASIEGGQVLLEPPCETGFQQLMKRVAKYGVNVAVLRKAYGSATSITTEKLESVLRLARLFADYFCEAGWRLRGSETESERVEIRRAREYIREHYAEPLSLPALAREVGLSPAYLSTIFSRSVGMSFTEFVQRMRIDMVRSLLLETERSITDIAFSTGFNSLTHFNYVFRKLEGCAPSHYRLHQGSEVQQLPHHT